MLGKVNLPAWQVDIIAGRARALNVSFDHALDLSLDLPSVDFQRQTMGWAIERGADPASVARRMGYSKRAAQDAARRFRRGD